MQEYDSIQDSTAESTSPDLDAIQSIPDTKIDEMFADLYPDEAASIEPDQAEVDTQTEVEETHEEAADEAPAVDDNSDIESAEADEVEETTAQDDSSKEYTLVDYDEAKDFKFPIKNKSGEIEYITIDQINSEINRGRGQQEALKDVEATKEKLAQRAEELDQSAFSQQQRAIVNAGQQHLNKISKDYNELQQAINQAVQEANHPGTGQARKDSLVTQINLWNATLGQMSNAYRDTEGKMSQQVSELNDARDKAASSAITNMQSFGIEDFSTDSQRVQAFQEYADGVLPNHLRDVVNTNGALLALLEKARLYDKANSSKPKLKGNGKSFRGSAAKPAAKSKPKNSMQSKIDNMFS